jgi:hypothetical protein
MTAPSLALRRSTWAPNPPSRALVKEVRIVVCVLSGGPSCVVWVSRLLVKREPWKRFGRPDYFGSTQGDYVEPPGENPSTAIHGRTMKNP